LNLSSAPAYAKVYDGIASVSLNGDRKEFAVEYERTLKAHSKYEKICAAIESETRLNAFLYLLPTTELMWSLVRQFQRTERLVLFARVREFEEKVFDAEVWTSRFDRLPFKEALLGLGGPNAARRAFALGDPEA
jgi:hypothetical protein